MFCPKNSARPACSSPATARRPLPARSFTWIPVIKSWGCEMKTVNPLCSIITFVFLFVTLICPSIRADPVTVSNINITVDSITYAKSLKAVQEYEKNPDGWGVTNLFDVARGYMVQRNFYTANL